jgi:NAD(P)-dependent dehydrogenase (short-subunit alcohol dehydrogenase family)
VLGVNVLGVIWTAQAFVPHMLMLEGPRHLVVTASSASIVDVQGPFTLYAASKQCTAAVGEALTAELTPKGVGVTILYPGLLNTNIWDAARARPERFGGPTRAPESIADYWRNAQNPEVLVAPLFKTVAAGGGRCVVDTTREARPLFEQRTRRISDAFA